MNAMASATKGTVAAGICWAWLAGASVAFSQGAPAAGTARSTPMPSANGFYFPASGIRVEGNAILLAIDDLSLPFKKSLCYYLSQPAVRPQPVLTPNRDNPNAPDYLGAHFYGTVLKDGDKFRMWYYGCSLGRNPDWPAEYQEQFSLNPRKEQELGPVCYAESDDGIHWVKPNLGQLLWKGTRANNALVLPNVRTFAAGIVKDDADPDPGRRYKMVYNYSWQGPGAFPGEESTVRAAWSPDGINWTVGPRNLVRSFIEMASFYRFNGLWILNGQKSGRERPEGGSRHGPGEGGSDRGRQGYVHVAADFPNFLPDHAESFALPDPPDPRKRGSSGIYDQVHMGVAPGGFGNVMVGLYGLWHNADNTNAFSDISCDLGLVVSNDGLLFREPVKGHVYISTQDSPVTPLPGKKYQTVLCQSNGIINVGDETRIYHGRWRNADFRYCEHDGSLYYAEIALATLPRDRWGALGLFEKEKEGSVISTPVVLPTLPASAGGSVNLTLNADGADAMRVEVLDERFMPRPGYSGDDSGFATQRSGFDCLVTWPKAKLAGLKGQTVRFRVTIRREGSNEPRIYAIGLRAGS